MSSARVRFFVEASVLVTIGVALAVAGVDLLVFGAIVAAALIVLAALERAVLQSAFPVRRDPAPVIEDGLPLHERHEPEAEVATAVAATSPPVWRPPVVEDVADAEEETGEDEPDEETAPPPFTGWPTARESPPDRWREPEPEFEAEPDPGREPEPVTRPPEPVAAAPEQSQEPAASDPVAPTPEATVAAGEQEPPVERAPEPPVERAPEPRRVVELPARAGREWNLWDLERRARERSGEDALQDEEWSALFVHLREYASPDGMLPPEFDDLVRESFAGLLVAS